MGACDAIGEQNSSPLTPLNSSPFAPLTIHPIRIAVPTRSYDRVFDSRSRESDFYQTQLDVFQYLGASILSCAWHGINTTLFAYGQTGSGKKLSKL